MRSRRCSLALTRSSNSGSFWHKASLRCDAPVWVAIGGKADIGEAAACFGPTRMTHVRHGRLQTFAPQKHVRPPLKRDIVPSIA
jgi:hypothetical protein